MFTQEKFHFYISRMIRDFYQNATEEDRKEFNYLRNLGQWKEADKLLIRVAHSK